MQRLLREVASVPCRFLRRKSASTPAGLMGALGWERCLIISSDNKSEEMKGHLIFFLKKPR